METQEYKSKISETFSVVRSFSYREKKNPLISEDVTNSFLDAILVFKTKIKGKAETISSITKKMDKLTWLTNPDDESLMLLNDLISSAKDLYSSLIRQYVYLSAMRKKGIAKEEIKCFKNTIDELKESIEDLESVFFFLPEMPEFVETTKQLSLI
jgi:uncharacterized phage infection (PIP) family protein YhgE